MFGLGKKTTIVLKPPSGFWRFNFLHQTVMEHIKSGRTPTAEDVATYVRVHDAMVAAHGESQQDD